MNQQQEIILKAIDGLGEAVGLLSMMVTAQGAPVVHLKSAAPKYSYSYNHAIDLGQGRTRTIHLTFALDPQTGELVLTGENVADSDG